MDGYCAVCGETCPVDQIICNDCLKEVIERGNDKDLKSRG